MQFIKYDQHFTTAHFRVVYDDRLPCRKVNFLLPLV